MKTQEISAVNSANNNEEVKEMSIIKTSAKRRSLLERTYAPIIVISMPSTVATVT